MRPIHVGSAARYFTVMREARNSVFTNALGLLWRIYRRWREEAQIRQAIRELSGFDDRTLKDIGLQRGEIENLLRCGRGQRR